MNKSKIGLVLGILVVLSMLVLPLASACGKKAVLEESNPIVLGLPTSLGFWFGQAAIESATLAVEEINKAGGVNVGGVHRPFKLESVDDRDSETGVPTADSLMAIEKLILEKHPAAIVVASNRSEVMLSAMDLNAKYKIPQIGTLAKSPTFQTKVRDNYNSYKYCFRLTTTSVYYGNYCVDLAKYIGTKFGINKVSFIYPDVAHARAAADVVRAALEKEGWQVVLNQAMPAGTTDFSMPLLKIKEAGRQVLMSFYDTNEVAVLVDQWATMKVPAIVAGAMAPAADVGAWKSYNGKVESLIFHVFEAGSYPVKSIAKSVTFFDDYIKRWGHEPVGVNAGAGVSYDAVYVMKDAIERAGSLDPDAIVAALEKTDISGTIGRIRFGADHQAIYGYDPKETAVGIFVQWQQPGKRVAVFPRAGADADIVLPPWMR